MKCYIPDEVMTTNCLSSSMGPRHARVWVCKSKNILNALGRLLFERKACKQVALELDSIGGTDPFHVVAWCHHSEFAETVGNVLNIRTQAPPFTHFPVSAV